MFTGIIEAKSEVISVKKGSSMRIAITKPRGWKLMSGQSISINGICTTVESVTRDAFSATYIPETLRVSTVADLAAGDTVNLERSLKVGDRLDGHFVQGHVDCVGLVTAVTQRGASRELCIRIPRTHMRLIAPKGSIAVHGISLTVARKGADWFDVALIPHTLAHTNAHALTKGSRVHIETDLIARHLATLRGK